MSYEYLAARYPLKFVMEPNRGSLAERVTGIAGVPIGIPATKPGTGLVFAGATGISYGNVFDITDTTQPFTWVWVGSTLGLKTTCRLFGKQNGAQGWFLHSYFISATSRAYQCYLRSGAGVTEARFVGVSLPTTRRSVTVIAYNGNTLATGFSAYENGAALPITSISSTAGANTLANAEPCVCGQLSTFTGRDTTSQGFAAFINQALTPAQVADLYQHLVQTLPAKRKPTKCFSMPFPGMTPSEYAARSIVYDCNLQRQQGKLQDLTGNGRVGTPTAGAGNCDAVGGPFGNALAFNRSRFNLPVDATMFRTDNWTISGWFREDRVVAATVELLQAPSLNHYFGHTTARRFLVGTRDAGGTLRAAVTGTALNVGKWTYFSGGRSLSGADLTLWIDVDGVRAATTTFAGVGAQIPAITSPAVGSSSFDVGGTLAALRFHTRALSEAEARAEWLQGAKTPLLDARLNKDGSVPVMPVAAGAGQEIPGTPWRVSTGTWQTREEAPVGLNLGERYVACVTAGTMYASDTSAYGSWYFKFRKTDLNSAVFVQFVDTRNFVGSTSQGYAIQASGTETIALYSFTGAAANVLFITAAAYYQLNTDYEIWVERNYAGRFTVWIRGGAYVNWTLVSTSGGLGTNPVTSATYTVSKYVAVNWDRNASERIYDYVHYLG